MCHAFGIAASAAGGLFAFVEGGDTKRLHPAHAVKAGIEAAIFARTGMEGPRDVLQGPNGFLAAYAGDGALRRAADLALSWDTLVADKCYIKPYACCRHLHPGMEAAMAIKTDEALTIEDIDSINVKTYAIAASHGDVGWEKAASAQLSYRYCVAAMLVHGWIVPFHFSEDSLRDPVVSELAARIGVVTDDTLDRRYPAERPASVQLVTTDGTVHEKTISIPLGAPERPLDAAGFREKLSRMLEPARDHTSVNELIEGVLGADLSSQLPGRVFTGQSGEALSAVPFTGQRIPAAPVRD
jgi:2-methylcitrate dehydratase PrpD